VWVWAVFGLVALAIWLLIVGSQRLLNQVDYTRKSKAGLFLCGAASLAVGIYVATRVVELPALFSFPIGGLAACALFIILSNAMVEAWRYSKLTVFDHEIDQLLERVDKLKSRLDNAKDKVLDESLRHRTDNQRRNDMVLRLEQLQQSVDSWQQGGGVTRIRTIKVEEWRSQYKAMSEIELAASRKALKADLQNTTVSTDTDSLERERQLKAQMAVLDIEVIDRHMFEHEAPAEPAKHVFVDSEQIKRELETARGDLELWRRKRAEFLAARIKLD
jgi:hypothetical protein